MIQLIKLVCTVFVFISLNLLSRLGSLTITYDHFHEPTKYFLCLSTTYNQAQSCKELASLMYIYLEPVCSLFWWLNPTKQGLFQSKQGSFGFQVYIYICLYIVYWFFWWPGYWKKQWSTNGELILTSGLCLSTVLIITVSECFDLSGQIT